MTLTTITRPTSDFTNRSFDSWIVELRSRVASAFPAWTDFTKPSFGNILLEMFAHTLDVMSFYQDQQFKETRVVFAQLRSSMISLGKNLGFSLPGATVATVDLQLTIADGNARGSDLVVPKGTRVATADRTVIFETTADATIAAGVTQISNVGSQNATAQSDSFVAPGTSDFPLILGGTPYVDGSGVVTIGVQSWAQAPNNDFYASGPTDRVYIVDVDDSGRATFAFGDGVNGAIPSGAGTVAYLTGGGSSGDVEANTLTVFVDGNRFSTTDGQAVALTARNPSGSGGGVNAMSTEEARVAIPAFVRTAGGRSVTHQDFEDNALKVRGAARAMLLTADDVNSIPENTGQLYIVPVGGGLPSSNLKTQVLNFILTSFPPTVTFALSVLNPTLQIIPITATVALARNVAQADARAAIEDALTNFFALVNADGAVNSQIDFGFKIRTHVMPPGSVQGLLPWSDIFNAIRNATTSTGVRVLREVVKNSVIPGSDVVLADVNFPVLGSVTLIDADTAASF